MQNRFIQNRNLEQAIQAKNVGKPKLLDEVRARLRALHFSKRTEEAYVAWIHRFLLHVKNLRGEWIHPSCLDSDDVNEFLTSLAVERNVAASTQNQALSALLFLFTKMLDKQIKLEAIRAKKPALLPVVLTPAEVASILKELPSGSIRVMGGLMLRGGQRCGPSRAAVRS